MTTESDTNDSSDFDTVSGQSSPPVSPTPSGDQNGSSNVVAPADDELALSAAKIPAPKEPATELGSAEMQQLDMSAREPAGEDTPIVSRGYYALPGDHDPTRQNSALSLASPMLRPSRETNRPATSPERGREQRTRSRSRRRTGDEDKRDEKMGTGNKDTSMRRPGPEARGSDSDAPPQAKAPKLGKSAAGKGDPPPQSPRHEPLTR
ncbi:hypothetical protein MTO96_040758 [Rhipicephalus appendiculatus]